MTAAVEALDHLLIGAPTLDVGISWLFDLTGVRAAPGGSHPGLGTWNALASLGPRQYIEIIAPDPGQPDTETFYVPGLRDLGEPRIATWAARATGVRTEFLSRLPPEFSCDAPREGSRVRPDGSRLAWTLAFPRHRDHATFGGLLPFFIEWRPGTTHPGTTTTPGLSLRSLSFRNPDPDVVRRALLALDLDARIEASDRASIGVSLETPRGAVTI